MTFKVTEQETLSRQVIADERLWLSEDGRVVGDGDPAAFELLAAPGQQVPRDRALALGLVKPTADEKANEAAADEAESVAAEGTVQDVLDQVGDDKALAEAALVAEQESAKPRKSLIAKLEAVRDA